MSYLDLFKAESTARSIYGVPTYGTGSAAKVLILSYLLHQVEKIAILILGSQMEIMMQFQGE